MAVIRSIRGGTAGLNEEERLTIARLLIKAGYSVKIGYRVIPGNTKGKKEYIVEYWEKGEKTIKLFRKVRNKSSDSRLSAGSRLPRKERYEENT